MGIQRKIKRNVAADVVTLGEAFEEFYNIKAARGLSASTLRNYKQSYEYFRDFCRLTDDSPTTEVQESFFYKWMNSMKIDGVKPTSINHYLRDCRAFFYWCMESNREYIAPAFKIEMVKAQEEAPKAFNESDILALLDKPRNNDTFADWRTWAIVNWILATGNRSSTIINLTIGDVDFRRMEIILKHTKSKKAQVIPLSTTLAATVKEYIKRFRDDATTDDYLFPNIGDEKLTTNGLRKAFTRYCQARGVEQTNIHGLRHTFAIDWCRNNGNMFVLQKMLGHSTLAMTKRYVQLGVEDMKADFDNYSPLDKIKSSGRRTNIIDKKKR